jgi:hypothetical protein
MDSILSIATSEVFCLHTPTRSSIIVSYDLVAYQGTELSNMLILEF